MKYTFHARNRIFDRFNTELIRSVKKKLARGDCTILPGNFFSAEACLVEGLPDGEALVVIKNKNIIITVITVHQFLERCEWRMDDEKIQTKLTKYCGLEKNGPNLKVKIGDTVGLSK